MIRKVVNKDSNKTVNFKAHNNNPTLLIVFTEHVKFSGKITTGENAHIKFPTALSRLSSERG